MRSGIYFLLNRDVVVYIGQTKTFPVRFNTYSKHILFDRLRFIPCDESLLLEYEKRWIKAFRPIYNKMHNGFNGPMYGKRNPHAGNKKGNSKLNNLKLNVPTKWSKKYDPNILVRAYKGKFRFKVERLQGGYYITRTL